MSIAVAQLRKRIMVFGARRIEWRRLGGAFIGPADAFTEMPVHYANAYGGIDPRVSVRFPRTPVQLVGLAAELPGSYPRNPFGKGYLVTGERLDGMELPNLEDPADLLTDDRLIVADPRQWYRQPLPWTFDWQLPNVLPRCLHIGADARFPAAPEALAEVRRGYVSPEYRRLASVKGPDGSAFRLLFRQEASLGMSFADLAAGTPIRLNGLHREWHAIDFAIPAPPRVEITVDGRRDLVTPRLTVVLIRPSEELVTLTYVARTRDLPRAFIPGVHRHIPLAVQIDGDPPIHYEAPATVYDRLVAGAGGRV